MALGTSQLVTNDTPSEVVRLTRKEFNALLDFVDSIISAAVAAADGNAFRVAVAALDPTTLNKIITRRELPAPPA